MLRSLKEKVQRLRTWCEGPLVRAGIKAALFGLLLLYVQHSGFSSFAVFLFIAWSLYMYLTPVARKFTATIAWGTLVALSLLMPSRFTLVTPLWAPHHLLPEHLFAVMFAALAFIFCVVARRGVLRVMRWYEVLHAGLLWGTSVLFMSGLAGLHPVRTFVLGAMLFYALTVEYAVMHGATHRRMVRLTAMLTTLVLVEMTWVLRLLPLSGGYAAALLALVAVLLTASSEQYLRGALRASFVRYALGGVVVVCSVVALLTRWVI